MSRLGDAVTDALRYWEPRRILYNGALAAIVAVYFFWNWPSSRSTVTFDGLLFLFILAILANIAYCVAYLGDVFIQFSAFREVWRRYRWVLFAVGTIFAAIITRFFAIGFFRSPG